MSKLDYVRLDDILNYLIVQKNPIPSDILCKDLNISIRTLRNDIRLINDYIGKNGARVKIVRKEGYQLQYDNKNKFDEFWSHEDTGTFLFTSSETRLQFLLRIFLTTEHFITKNYLLDTMFVSQNTLYSDLRKLKTMLAFYDIKIQNKSNLGYTVKGKEEDIRRAIVNLIFQDDLHDFIIEQTTTVKDVCANVDYDLFSELFYSLFDEIKLSNTDYFEKLTFVHLLLSVSRIKSGHKINHVLISQTKLSKKYDKFFIQFIREIENKFQIEISDNEKSYFLFILSENYPNIISSLYSVEHNEILADEIVKAIIHNLSTSVASNWVFDTDLHDNLKNHILRALNIQIINGSRTNPIIKQIKNNFPYAFELAVNEMSKVEIEFGLSFSEDEISFIALYFENAIEKHRSDDTNKLSVAIICGTGKIVSSIIESKLMRKFIGLLEKIDKLSYREYKACNCDEYDLIISTIPNIHDKTNVYYLDISNFEQNFKNLEGLLKKKRERITLFYPQLLHVVDRPMTKEQLLQHLSEQLVNENFVYDSFYQDVLQREKISNTVLDNVLAIPHPIKNSVKKSAISVAILPKGILWNGSNIKFVFLLAIKADDIQALEFIYERMIDFSTSLSLQERLLKDRSIDALNSIFILS